MDIGKIGFVIIEPMFPIVCLDIRMGKSSIAFRKMPTLITEIDSIERFRDENYKSFVFAVYMVILLILGMILSFVQKIVYRIYCKMRGVKPRYDA